MNAKLPACPPVHRHCDHRPATAPRLLTSDLCTPTISVIDIIMQTSGEKKGNNNNNKNKKPKISSNDPQITARGGIVGGGGGGGGAGEAELELQNFILQGL